MLLLKTFGTLCDSPPPIRNFDMESFLGDWYFIYAGSAEPDYSLPECFWLTLNSDLDGTLVEEYFSYDISSDTFDSGVLDAKYHKSYINFGAAIGMFLITWVEYESFAVAYQCDENINLSPTIYVLARDADFDSADRTLLKSIKTGIEKELQHFNPDWLEEVTQQGDCEYA
mmetsp:Transcript_30562/g.22659  ORF Transcript_30562/g.22659 Transcript_30562/m.22659 type:complete len:171 (+) Transcript_30562:58-570(+)